MGKKRIVRGDGQVKVMAISPNAVLYSDYSGYIIEDLNEGTEYHYPESQKNQAIKKYEEVK